MPCYEPRTKFDDHYQDFLIAALCYSIRFLSIKQIKRFPGLKEWIKRHNYIDKHINKNMMAAYDYQKKVDKRSAYDEPLFFEQWWIKRNEK